MKVNVIEHDKKKDEHFLIISDLHERYLDRPAFDIMLKYARAYNVINLIINGDFLDCSYLMPKNPEFKKHIGRSDGIEAFFLPMWEETCLWANDILDELGKVFKKIYYLKGNHCQRVDYFREDYCPCEYKYHFDISVKLDIKKRGMEIFEYNDYVDLGNVSITHGMYHSPTHLKSHYQTCGRSIIVGHVHRDEKQSFTTRGKTNQAQSLPCMCNMELPYLKGKDTSWTLGFGHLILKPNGHFHYSTLNIWDNELHLNDGRVIK
jgi:hypothetical protein